ncbi:T9SS type A sorting domain-containing protein [Hymenobacter aquaticus]|uniref:T9SS type A sorting domain-containing protein n=1 Tax=Hymenobacter aquaticus TaxID=1867101 RepID=A0A4Z0PU10_9BACT|nr:T9SS type A sorting domain-containing protein [Hymenobacter aquaticus]TGE21270.1 T9SS type A sorting domain-containing protein [Hymenobacter aquaticus]
MKKHYLFLAAMLLGFGPARAQKSMAVSVPTQQIGQQEQNYLFAPLDKSQIPTGFLADYAIPLVPLDIFNGTLTDSSRTTPDGFRYLYGTVYTANITGNNPLPTLQTLNARIDADVAAAGNAIPLMVQRISYSAVRPDAFSANLLSYQNGQVYDVPGRAQSPYAVKTVFAAAPATTYSASGTVSFVFPQDLFIQNGGNAPSSLSIDFGDGRGYVTTGFGQPISANYGTAGTKRIKVRATFSLSFFPVDAKEQPGKSKKDQIAIPIKNTVSYESHFDIEVAQPACTNCRYGTATPNIDFPARAGVHAGATVSIRYGGTHTQLTKPLIVVEGYDKHFIAPAIQKDNYSITQFMQEISNPGNYNLYNDLDNLGQYDIVFIDFKNGTDDLLRNAQVFEEVVNYVNANKVGGIASGQANAVIGISMGGLISRYKLAEMTKAGRNSHTRLLILQDSPQRGANVPLGIQALSRQAVFNVGPFSTADMSDALKQANLLLDEPATRQLLVHRATDGSGGFEANTFLNGTYRNMITFGATQPAYRTVAVSQGSQCGVSLFAPYAELARLNGRLFISPLPWISRVSYETELVVNALPAGGQSRRVSYISLKQKIRLLFGLFTSTQTLFQRQYNCPSGLLAWDGVPGGTEPVSGVPGGFRQRYGGSWMPFIDASVHAEAVESFSFLPTASGIDASIIDQNSLQSAYIYGVSTTPTVNKFIAQESFSTFGRTYYNQPHTVFTDRNGQWIFNELEGRSNTVLNCTSQCNPYPATNISGSNVICSGAASLYTITPPFGAVTGWTVSPAGIVTASSTPGSNEVTLTPVSANSVGTVTLTAQMGNGCFVSNSQPLQIAIGYGRLQLTASATEACPGFPVYFSVSSIGTDGDYHWEINGVPSPQYDGMADIEVAAGNSGTSVAVSASTCNTQTWAGTYVNTPNLPPYVFCPVYRGTKKDEVVVSTYPNPVQDRLTVQRPVVTSAPLTVRLYDSYSREQLSKQLTGAALQLDTRRLAPGIYFLHVLDGKKVLSREQIQVTH